MKINKLLNISKIKKALLVIALASLSFSNVHAVDYIINNTTIFDVRNETEANGTIQFIDRATGDFSRCYFGNSSGDRFSIISDNLTSVQQYMYLYGSTFYLSSMDINNDFYFSLEDSSNLYLDTPLITALNNNVTFGIHDNSTMIAPSVSVSRITMSSGAICNFVANVNTINMSYSSTWTSIGSSTIAKRLTMDRCTVELIMTSMSDAISVGEEIHLSGINYFNFNFTNDFIDSMMAGAGYFDLVFADTIIGSMTFSHIYTEYNINVADSNDSYSWTVTDLGGEAFRISQIIYTGDGIAIPEPSTYAVIFGLIALAFVAYKRLK